MKTLRTCPDGWLHCSISTKISLYPLNWRRKSKNTSNICGRTTGTAPLLMRKTWKFFQSFLLAVKPEFSKTSSIKTFLICSKCTSASLSLKLEEVSQNHMIGQTQSTLVSWSNFCWPLSRVSSHKPSTFMRQAKKLTNKFLLSQKTLRSWSRWRVNTALDSSTIPSAPISMWS